MKWALLAACAASVAATTYPLPSAAQVRWMRDEVTGMGSYNMGTYEACGIGAVTFEGNSNNAKPDYIYLPKGDVFNPTNLDVEQWIVALKTAGVKHAVLTLSHGCGYALYPTNTAFPSFNFTYAYNIRESPYKGGKGDIAREFVDSCRRHGIRPGFYNGVMNNAYLNVVRGVAIQKKAYEGQVIVTQDQYTQIILANLRQQWTDYGELAEVWFDGGYPKGAEAQIAALFKELQPTCVAFGGPADQQNDARWVGTETAHPGYPIWSTAKSSGDAGRGEADGPVFVPAESDSCFQTRSAGLVDRDVKYSGPYGGCWFYNPQYVPKSVKELMSMYHDTVGANAYLMIDWSPRPQGDLPESHLARYIEWGDYRAACYTPVFEASPAQLGNFTGSNAVSFQVPAGVQVDRLSIGEDQEFGQRIRTYTISDATGAQLTNGTSVGNRRIAFLSKTVTGPTTLSVKLGAADLPLLSAITMYKPCPKL